MSKTSQLNAGDEVLSWCGVCKEDRIHKVIAIVAGKKPKCICMTCNAQHNLRAKPGAMSAAKTAASKRAAESAQDAAWEEAMKNISESDAKAYTIADRFDEGDVVNHASFGLGKVIKLLDSNKIHILFRSGIKPMVHGMQR